MSLSTTAFFFGSGISFESFKRFGAGVGTVGNITRRALTEQWQEVGGVFVPAVAGAPPVLLESASRAQRLLQYVKGELDGHLRLRDGRESHYEDLYAACLQILQDESGEIPNPLIARSAKEIRSATAPHYVGLPLSGWGDQFLNLIDGALRLIQSVVWHELGQVRDPVKMDVISDVARRASSLDIFTLNHDTLVERLFDRDSVAFNDGFGSVQDGYRIFNGDWDGEKVNLLKLHGSVNWHLSTFTGAKSVMKQYARFDREISTCFYDGHRVDARPLPEFLTGTTVKEQAYGYSVIGEIFAKFRKFSSDHRRIVCSGYSFGDKGINIRLDQWLNDQNENILVILHAGDVSQFLSNRFWFRRWGEFSRREKVVIVPKWLGDFSTAAEIEPVFNLSVGEIKRLYPVAVP
jgi:SIR2-like domain